jgi:L-threonylcarbamoyladenylate synthase
VTRLPLADKGEAAAAGRAARDVIAGGGVVLLPTETFYGLAVDPCNVEAIARVRAMKRRPPDLGLPVLCADWQQVEALVKVPARHRVRLGRIWPGPLTVVLPCSTTLPAAVGGSLALRIPGHSLLRAVLYRVGAVTGTSANRHGEEPAATVEDALARLDGAPELVLDGGRTAGGRATTLVDLTGEEPRLLREGDQPWEEPFLWEESRVEGWGDLP